MKKAKVSWVENVSYQLRDKNGKVKKLFQVNWLGSFLLKKLGFVPKIPLIFGMFVSTMLVKNLVTSAGKAGLASRVNGDGAVPAFLYIGLGTGSTAPVVGNTALENEISTNGGSRAVGAASRATTNVVNDTARVSKTFAFSGSLAITESGLFSAVSGGVMVARQVFAVMNVEDGNELVITWDLSNA